VDAADLRRKLAAMSEASLEDDAWEHGAFTRALLMR
jgi:hypothetical protein